MINKRQNGNAEIPIIDHTCDAVKNASLSVISHITAKTIVSGIEPTIIKRQINDFISICF